MSPVPSLTSDELTSPTPDPWMGNPSHCSSVAIFLLTQKHTSHLKYEPRSLGSDYSKYHVPVWYQLLRVFVVTEHRKVISTHCKCILETSGRQVTEQQGNLWKRLIGYRTISFLWAGGIW